MMTTKPTTCVKEHELWNSRTDTKIIATFLRLPIAMLVSGPSRATMRKANSAKIAAYPGPPPVVEALVCYTVGGLWD